MDIQNNSVVTDVDTEILDIEIDQISNYLSETHYFDNEQEEELELLVAKAMKLGELYERKKWQAAKAQAVPEGFILVPKDSLKVALSWMNEDVDPWQMGGDSFAELYEHKPILEKAMIEAQEQK